MRIEPERLKSDFFGEIRGVDILHNEGGKDNEIFFSIERRDKNNKYLPHKSYGYITKTKEMEDFIRAEFFTGCNKVEFIQWEHEWNVVFEEAHIIGGVSFRMDFEEFDKLFGVIFAQK